MPCPPQTSSIHIVNNKLLSQELFFTYRFVDINMDELSDNRKIHTGDENDEVLSTIVFLFISSLFLMRLQIICQQVLCRHKKRESSFSLSFQSTDPTTATTYLVKGGTSEEDD